MDTTIRPGHTIAVKIWPQMHACTAVDDDKVTLSNGETLRPVYCTPLEPYQEAFPVGARVLMQTTDTVGTIEGPIAASHGHLVAPIRWDTHKHVVIDWDVKGLRLAR